MSFTCVAAYSGRAIGGVGTRYARRPGGVVRQGGTAGGSSAGINGLAEGQRLADGDPLRILGLLREADPAGAVTGHHTGFLQVSAARPR
jgi:hypothetical protein